MPFFGVQEQLISKKKKTPVVFEHVDSSGSSNRRVSDGTSCLAEQWRTEGKFKKTWFGNS